MAPSQNLLKVSHQTIYHMMMYVYSDLYDENIEKQADFCGQLDDMMTDLLISGIVRQLRRGLYKEYVRKEEPAIMIRGKIDIHSSIKLRTQQSQQLVCAYDAFDKDNLYNQILKSTCLYILRQGRVSKERRKKLKDLLFNFHEVSEIPLRAITWESIRFHKDKFAYRSLIGLCYIIYKGLMLEEKSGQTYVQSVVMADLYERFIQKFYVQEWPLIELGYQGKYNSDSSSVTHIRNILTVDMVLTYKSYRLIINTHYFENLFTKQVTGEQIQFLDEQMQRLLGTVKRNAFNTEGRVEGFLLYPSLEKTCMQCNEEDRKRIYLGNIDLSGPFEELKGLLMEIGEMVMRQGK